eukprot:6006918-Alexandrium_andersonii.AAC.1
MQNGARAKFRNLREETRALAARVARRRRGRRRRIACLSAGKRQLRTETNLLCLGRLEFSQHLLTLVPGARQEPK